MMITVVSSSVELQQQQQQQTEQREAPVCHNSNANEDCRAEPEEENPCQMYFAPSPWNPEQWTLYSAVEIKAGTTTSVFQPDLFLSITDANPNEYSPWHDLVWDPLSITTTTTTTTSTSKDDDGFDSEPEHVLYPDALWENNYLHQVLLGGIGAVAECGGPDYANIELFAVLSTHTDNNKETSSSSSSSSPRQLIQARAVRDIRPGEALLTPCQATNKLMLRYYKKFSTKTTVPLDRVVQRGMCMDALSVQPSSISGGGYGAHAKKAVAQGQVVFHSPVLLFDRSQLNVVEQHARTFQPNATSVNGNSNNRLPQFARGHGIQFDNTKITRKQLLSNYVYGRDDSNVVLWPMAPGANFIQHATRTTTSEPNVQLQWSRRFGNAEELLSSELYPVMELFEMAFGQEGNYLVVEYVALRDIQPGDEIRSDYGSDWQAAWDQQEQEKQGAELTAHEYMQRHPSWEPLSATPPPSHLQTACHFMKTNEQELASITTTTSWQTPFLSYCWRPCDIIEQPKDSLYTAIVHSMESAREPPECGILTGKSIQVTQIPRQAIRLMNRPYTLPEYSSQSFRHEISVPLQDDFYPRHWLLPDPAPYGDFIASPLPPGMMAPIRWQSSSEVVTPWAFRVGVPASVRQVLLEYCESMGIMDVFRHVTSQGNALQAKQNGYLPLPDGTKWYLQRPGPEWRSNLHWLSPGDERSHFHYLQALSVAGFDTVLEGVGKYLGMDSLVAFHVTFIAVSQSTEGYQHHDVLWTGAKTYNVIIPLLLANHTGPELDLVEGPSYEDGFDDQEERIVGRYRYEYEVASMMGDGAVHATSAVDYRRHGEMRLAATIYIADVNEENVDSILKEYTQAYPPDDRDLLLSWAGQHWNKTDPSARLPRPLDDHIIRRGKPKEESTTSSSS